MPDRPGLLSPAYAPVVRRRGTARSAAGAFLRLGFSHHPLPWRGCSDREALRVQAESAAEGHSGLPGGGRRDARLLLRDGELRKDQQNDEVLRFVRFWKERTGQYPEELIFDSKLTTYANLNESNRLGIQFITLRLCSSGLVREIDQAPSSAWRQIELKGVSRQYTTPRILDRRITLSDYDGPVRQVTVTDLGHEEPTILLTNQLTRTASKLVGRYAQRMIIENSIADGIDFFHMDALSSAVAMKVNCDLQLTLMASSLYRLLAGRIGRGDQRTESRHLFRDFVDATAEGEVKESSIVWVSEACS